MKLKLYADGGSRGNPGIAGSGAVLIDASGQVLRELIYAVGRSASNNVAEYHGLIIGLEAAAELGASQVDVFMDSKLVVEQMSGRWKIKHPAMQKLALKARGLAQSFEKVTYTWVPRQKNEHADALSNKAMDAAAQGALGDISPASETPENPEPAAKPASWLKENNGEPMTQLILVRHGQTEANARGVYSGRGDVELTERGRAQASAAAEVIARSGADAVLSSPLGRCQETAQIIAQRLGRKVHTLPELIECDFGAFEGLTFAEARERDPEFYQRWKTSLAVPAPGGESTKEVAARVAKLPKFIMQNYPGQKVVAVSHVTPIKALLCQALGVDAYDRLFLSEATISVIDLYGPQARTPMVVHSLGETQHTWQAQLDD